MGDRKYFAVHAAQRTKSSTVQALNNIAEEFQQKYEALPEDWHWIVLLDFIVPAVVALLLCGLGIYLVRAIFYFIFPQSAPSLHEEALQRLQLGKEKQAETLLNRAIARSKSAYDPAVLSLAALYIYRHENPKKAIAVLDNANIVNMRKTSKEPREFSSIRRDAEAFTQGNKNMVLIPVAEAEFLSALNAVAR